MKPEIVRDIGRKNLMAIGDRLRDLATWVDENPDLVRTVLVISAGHADIVTMHGFGERASGVETLGWLALAVDHVLAARDRGTEWGGAA